MEKVKSLQIKGFNKKGVECLCDSTLFPDDAKWFETKDGYAKSSKYGLMHRYIMGFKKNDRTHLYVDHIDGNRLNNLKSNLRITTPKQNAKNRSNDPNIPSTEDHKELFGVGWDENMECFVTIHKTRFFYWSEDKLKCALCYDSIIFYIYGPGKRLNDNKARPLPLSFWKLNQQDLDFIEKLKSRYTDYIGVKWCKDGWKCEIKVNLGIYKSKEEAAKAYDRALKKIKDLPNPEELNFSH